MFFFLLFYQQQLDWKTHYTCAEWGGKTSKECMLVLLRAQHKHWLIQRLGFFSSKNGRMLMRPDKPESTVVSQSNGHPETRDPLIQPTHWGEEGYWPEAQQTNTLTAVQSEQRPHAVLSISLDLKLSFRGFTFKPFSPSLETLWPESIVFFFFISFFRVSAVSCTVVCLLLRSMSQKSWPGYSR